MATKAQLEAAKNSLLASNATIPASRHRQFEQVLIDELYDAQSRFKLMAELVSVASLDDPDLIPVMKNGVAHVIAFEDLLLNLEQQPLTDGSGTTANFLHGIDLGGIVDKDTFIEPNLLGFHAVSFGKFQDTYFDSFEAYANAFILEAVSGSGISLIHRNGYQNNADTVRMDLSPAGFNVGAYGIYAPTFKGIEYADDYSANFEPQSIPSVQWVLDQLASLSPNLVDGEGTTIPVSGDRVNLGGAFTTVQLTGGVGSLFDLVAEEIQLTSTTENIILNKSVDVSTNTQAWPSAVLRTEVGNGVGANGLGAMMEFQVESNVNDVFAKNAGIIYQLEENDATPNGVWTFLAHGAGGNRDNPFISFHSRVYGLYYPADVSAENAGNLRWIPDKAYVDNLIAGVGPSILTPVIVSGTSHLFTAADHGKFFYATNAAGCTFTVPAGLPDGWRADVGCDADGDDVSFVASGTTLNGEGTSLINPLTGASIIHLGGNAYFLAGALTENPANITKSKTIAIPTPVNGDDFGFYTDRSITIVKLNDWIQGTSSPTVTWNIHFNANANAVPGTTLLAASRVTTSLTGASTTTFANAVIPAGSYVRLRPTSVGGSITQLAVTLTFLES